MLGTFAAPSAIETVIGTTTTGSASSCPTAFWLSLEPPAFCAGHGLRSAVEGQCSQFLAASGAMPDRANIQLPRPLPHPRLGRGNLSVDQAAEPWGTAAWRLSPARCLDHEGAKSREGTKREIHEARRTRSAKGTSIHRTFRTEAKRLLQQLPSFPAPGREDRGVVLHQTQTTREMIAAR